MARNLEISVSEEKNEYYFISYNTEDAERVKNIVKKLEQNGVPMWCDYGIDYGNLWEQAIGEHIKNCKAVLLFLSNGIFSKTNSYVMKEYEIATKFCHKDIYVVFLDEIQYEEVPTNMMGWIVDLEKLQGINYNSYTREEDFYKELLLLLKPKRKLEETQCLPLDDVINKKIADWKKAIKESGNELFWNVTNDCFEESRFFVDQSGDIFYDDLVGLYQKKEHGEIECIKSTYVFTGYNIKEIMKFSTFFSDFNGLNNGNSHYILEAENGDILTFGMEHNPKYKKSVIRLENKESHIYLLNLNEVKSYWLSLYGTTELLNQKFDFTQWNDLQYAWKYCCTKCGWDAISNKLACGDNGYLIISGEESPCHIKDVIEVKYRNFSKGEEKWLRSFKRIKIFLNGRFDLIEFYEDEETPFKITLHESKTKEV